MSTFDQLTGMLPLHSLLHQRYRLVALAGRGGMSAVYRGIDTRQGDRAVAVKEMSQGHLDESERKEAIARFQQEYQLLHELQHPNLPLIYDTFDEDNRWYLVMDFIEGKTLLDLLRENGGRPLAVAAVIDYASQLCDVLSYLHSRNPPVIFRDLKPTNVMVRDDGRMFLIDFGIARFFKEGQQQDTVLLGSPGYAPPEQHGSGQTGPRSDIYALGATLHCCLTGRDPFHAPDRFQFPPARMYNQQVPVELEQLMQRMVAMDERQRPASMLEVKHELVKMKLTAYPPNAPLRSSGPAPETVQPVLPGQATQPTHLPPPANMYQVPFQPAQPTSMATGFVPAPVPASAAPARVWTAGFLLIIALILVLTIGGTLLVFNFSNHNGGITNLDSIVECVLAVVFIVIALGASASVRNRLAVTLLVVPVVLTTIAALSLLAHIAGFAHADSLGGLFEHGRSNDIIKGGLVGTSIISLLWLFRPYQLLDRVVLLIFFGAATICSLLAVFATPGDSSDSLAVYVIFCLIALMLGVLIAARTEQVRRLRA